ncbi:Two-component system yycF/yycG regulatory protein yycH [Listeria grayi]|nr:two-component system activity regulator YycH [Listeria grayi]EUJ30416.1 hypothetical protein LMUR_01010 [Listeria grayi FSL F6-1183]MBC1921574.1 transcriptional regulator [Listeria grayi]STY45014.1 Two-component system yycF/yycG regulatory protein yycH [Listeria grayi]VEI31196.1 Two-component system yycF/yycG regulatory protein yycH [Listeria grayi]
MTKRYGFRGLLLTILVIISIVLSYSIWKGQPNYEAINVKNVEKTTISKEQTAAQTFKPYKVIWNKDGKQFSSNDETAIKSLSSRGTTFGFSEVLVSEKKKTETYESIIHQNDTFELVYPTTIPFTIFSQVFHVSGKNLQSDSFNRIIFDKNASDTGLHTVYFANDQNHTIYQSSLQEKDMNEVASIVNKAKDTFIENDVVIDQNRRLYLSSSPLNIDSRKFIISSIKINLFISALFQDSDSIKNEGNNYTNGSSIIQVNPEYKTLEYVNQAQERNRPELLPKQKQAMMIQDSFNFVNEHAGWTGNFTFAGYDVNSGSTNFMLDVHNMMVFNPDKMTTISVAQGQESVFRYTRPYYMFESEIYSAKRKVKLESSYSAYQKLIKSKAVDPQNIDAMAPGYEMKRSNWENTSSLNRVVELEPVWMFQYKGTWFSVNDTEGGN